MDKKEQAQLINSGVRSSGEIWDYKQSGKIPAKSEEPEKGIKQDNTAKKNGVSKMDNEAISGLIHNRTKSHHGIYGEIGTALKDVPTNDLVRYFVEVTMKGEDLLLRDFIEGKIIASEIEKEQTLVRCKDENRMFI